MCIEKGQLRNVLINKSDSNYPLAGMISPTFQNEGTASVIIDGRKLDQGDSFSINVPGVMLTNSIAITFEQDNTKTRKLYVGFVSLDQ